MVNFSMKFDSKFDDIEHYKFYPEMKPWVGDRYAEVGLKVLIIGESHYLKSGSNYHHDAKAWYDGVKVSDKKDWGWIKTRDIISNGIAAKWKGGSKLIYKNIEKGLYEAGFCGREQSTAFSDIAFLNYFQRPAQKTGESIKVTKLDSDVSHYVVSQVVATISPDIVIFASSLAWKHAKQSGLVQKINGKGIKCTRVPHPGMPWWNRVSKAYGNKTGKQHFVSYIKETIK